MSASPLTAAEQHTSTNRCFGPIGDIADQPFAFNDLVVSINT